MYVCTIKNMGVFNLANTTYNIIYMLYNNIHINFISNYLKYIYIYILLYDVEKKIKIVR